MSEGRPHLVAVPEAVPLPVVSAGGPGRRVTALALAFALLCALGFGLARRQLGQLERELTRAQQTLAETRASLAAIEAQRNDVRAQLQGLAIEASALAGRLSELEALVATDPERAADAQPVRSEASLPD